MLHRLLIPLAFMLALSVAGAIWRAFWMSGTGLRTLGGLQRLNRRVFGPPKPQPVELGPDGRWRPFVGLGTRRAERRAGWALWFIAAVFAALVIFSMATGR